MPDKKPEPKLIFKPVSRIGRAALIRLYGRAKAQRLWERGPADDDDRVPVTMPKDVEPNVDR